jgi:hypothetical protein
MAVLCGLNGGSAQEVIIAVLSAGLDKESNAAIDNIFRFGNIDSFWQLIQKYTGYINSDDKPLSDTNNKLTTPYPFAPKISPRRPYQTYNRCRNIAG